MSNDAEITGFVGGIKKTIKGKSDEAARPWCALLFDERTGEVVADFDEFNTYLCICHRYPKHDGKHKGPTAYQHSLAEALEHNSHFRPEDDF